MFTQPSCSCCCVVAGTCHPAGSVQNVVQPVVSSPVPVYSAGFTTSSSCTNSLSFLCSQGQCECHLHVEGPVCDRCKPLYWNLSPDSPDGCSGQTLTLLATVSVRL